MLKKKSMRHSLSEGHLPPGHPDLSHPLANSAAIVKDGNMNGINENGADGDDGKLSRQSSVLSLFDNTSPFVIPKVTREHWKKFKGVSPHFSHDFETRVLDRQM